jgi:extracellular factor (EF) 3-hydroxypalmitic acid methyl ester biosynthesis protein
MLALLASRFRAATAARGGTNPPSTMTNTNESVVLGTTSQGGELHGNALRLSRHSAAFEIYDPRVVLRLSEVFADFKIVANERTLYKGRAVVTSVLNTGTMIVCEVTLDESGWLEVDLSCLRNGAGSLAVQYADFIGRWQKNYKVAEPYKIVVADMRTFFMDLHLWLDQVELGIRASPSDDRLKLEQGVTDELAAAIIPSVDVLFEKFESAAEVLGPEVEPFHSSYMRRHLHPLVLGAPFPHRTFYKPLGYAGDYEMVNMIARDGHEGGSLYAKIVNCWFLKQAPSEAHRNRLRYLENKLLEEALRVVRAGRRPRVCNLACGPAVEVQRFVAEQSVSERAHFTLIDFNDETLEHVQTRLYDLKAQHHRDTSIRCLKRSVQNILRESARILEGAGREQYDFVYCAGLFDYLPDIVCRSLTEILYDWVAPGGLLLVTNVEPSNPRRKGMEHLLDWHLIYRTGAQFSLLRPRQSAPDWVAVRTDVTGVNLFLEIRKPDHAQRNDQEPARI